MTAALLTVPRTAADIENQVYSRVHNSVELRLRFVPGRDDLLLEFIQVPVQYRGNGFADEALTVVCELADLAGWSVRLQPSDGFSSDKGRLCRWYARHGFIPEGNPNWVSEIEWMHRTPKLGGRS